MLFTTLGLGGMLATLPGTLELATLTASALLPPRAKSAAGTRPVGRLAIVVPAHDEEEGIAKCVKSLLACHAPPNGFTVHVIADNCSDRTAERAREAGAQVIERNDRERRGKGYALELAFGRVLADSSVDAVIVVDADTEVEPNFVLTMHDAFARGADGAQARYAIANADHSTKTRLMNVAFLAFNVVRPRGRERLGLSVGILGNGFGLHRRVLDVLPYTARSVVEDLEYHLMLVRRGFRMEFLGETSVRADMPLSDDGIATQRSRWEGGRYRMIREHVPGLAREVLGDARLTEPLFELLLLPLGTHVGLLCATLVVPFPPTQIYAAGALGVVAAHVASALYLGGADREDAKALLTAPLYVAKKVLSMPAILRASRKEQAWVRTRRDAPSNGATHPEPAGASR